ncbi:hypothetical protein [Thalassospira sp. MCCC 1A02898]|uniref:hypothetical protein n=2 Tax=unclassified Thalassospira TaxID=2648997 RepID=UPI0018DD4FDE|nr:hypothetical protein [Thalassospira sp. MCCC 1A02898]
MPFKSAEFCGFEAISMNFLKYFLKKQNRHPFCLLCEIEKRLHSQFVSGIGHETEIEENEQWGCSSTAKTWSCCGNSQRLDDDNRLGAGRVVCT